MGKESRLQKAVLDYLTWFSKSNKIYFFRSGSGHIQTQSGHYFKTGRPGVQDITCCYNSTFIALEIKTATGRQSALQVEAEKEIQAAGGEYHIIRSLENIKRIFPL